MYIKNLKLVSATAIAIVLIIAIALFLKLNDPSNNITSQLTDSYSKIEHFKIADHARKITVRVSGENRSGSGVLISRRESGNPNLTGYYYLVLTCYHNVLPDSSANSKIFYVFTSDNIAYPASLLRSENQRLFPDIDLDLLYFYSPLKLTYEIAIKPTKSTTIKSNDTLIVAGHPCEGDGCLNINPFKITRGVATLIDKPLSNGYQIGFNKDFKEGTSGGAVLNSNNQLVGIAGKRKGIYNNSNQQYTYADKSLPSSYQLDQYKNLAWVLPVNENILDKSDKLFLNTSFQEVIYQNNNFYTNKNLNSLTVIYSEIKTYFLSLNVLIIILLFIIIILLILLCYLLVQKKFKTS